MVEDPVKALIAFGLGCVALLAGYFLDYSCLSRYAGKIYLGTLVIGLIAERYSPIINGAPYYARFITLIFPIIYALWLYACRNKGWRGLIMAILGGVPLALFCCGVPYILGLAVHLISGFVLILMAAWNDWFGIGRWKSLIPPLACAGTIAGIFTYMIIVLEWGFGRLSTAFYPEIDPLGSGFQALRIRDALGLKILQRLRRKAPRKATEQLNGALHILQRGKQLGRKVLQRLRISLARIPHTQHKR